MIHKGFLHRILFLDIETVPLFSDFDELNEREQVQFESQTKFLRKEIPSSVFYEKAGLWAEFGKIICISTAYKNQDSKDQKMVLKSFYGEDEQQVLLNFKEFLDERFYKKIHLLCAHNGKEFDFPYLARRMIINAIALPDILNIIGKKPWEVRHLDTLELWKFGDYKHHTSLELLSAVLGIHYPRQKLKAKDIRMAYYEQNGMAQIVKHCEDDAFAVAQVYFRLIDEPIDDLFNP